MRRLLMVIAIVGVLPGCDSASGTDDQGADSGRDVPVVTDAADPGSDPGGTPDPGRDPGTPQDPGMPDPGRPDVVDPGPGQDPGPQDGTAMCPQAVGGSSCHEIAACAIQCADPVFQAACAVQPAAGATDAWDDLRTCISTAACDPVFHMEQYADCVLTNCRAKLTACAPSPGGSCRDIWKCRKDCDPDDAACPARCFGLGSAEAQATWIAYKDCILGIECASTDINANGWPTWTCEAYGQNHNCPIQAQACFPPTT